MDTIAIDDLSIECVIGADPEERERTQAIFVSVEIETDFSSAANSDALPDAIDYRALSGRLASIAVGGRFRLIESLARALLDECLADPRAIAATVVVRKPGVPPGAACARAVSSRRKGQSSSFGQISSTTES